MSDKKGKAVAMDKTLTRRMVDTATAAEAYSHAPGTLSNWRHHGVGPRWFRCGRRALYRPEDLEEFFSRQPVLTAASLPERGNRGEGSK
jgi:hypothetical protein